MKRILPLVLLAACGGYREAAVRTADRARAPTSGQYGAPSALPDPRGAAILSTFGHAKARASKLGNGVRVVYLERHDLPIVGVTVALSRGNLDEQPGAVDVLFDLLEKGPKTRKPSIRDYLGWLGARSSTFVEPELSGMTFETLSSHTTSLVLTSGEMLAQSSYDGEEQDEAKRALVAALRSSRTSVDDAATHAALATFGLRQQPDPDVADKVTIQDVERAYGALVAADSVVVAAVGDFDAAQMNQLLEKAFGSLRGTAKPPTRATPAPTQEKFVLLDRAKGEQSAILVTTPAPRLQDPDAAGFQLACAILGSRLEGSTRIAKGYTYGGHTSCSGFAPYMKVTVDVSQSRTKEALGDVLSVIGSLRDAPPTNAEVARARSWLARSMTARFTTNLETSKELARAVAAGLAPDVLATVFDGTSGVTPDQVQALSQKWMADPHVVVVGDATAITGDISTVGLGAPVVRSMP
jgi:predicted Zn-dependent peptidase